MPDIDYRRCIFEGLTETQLERFVASSRTLSFSAGDTVFREGDPASSMYVIMRGEVTVDIGDIVNPGQMITFATFTRGFTVGEAPAVFPVNDSLRRATVVALTNCELLEITTEMIEANTNVAAIIYRNLARIFAVRISELSDAYMMAAGSHK